MFSGGVLAIALHAAVIAFALRFEPAHSPIRETAPIRVRLLAPAPQQAKRENERLKPLPVKPRMRAPASAPKVPVMTASPDALASSVAPSPAPPQPLVEPVTRPAPAAAFPAPPTPAPAPPAPVVPPSFSADYLMNPAPAYPPLSRRLGEEGKVVLRVFVNEQGLPAKVELRTSSGFSRLDSVALETVRQWKFVAARRGDQAVTAWVLVPISFSLRS
jgi:protein TonB